MKRSKQAVAVILNQDLENVGFAGELITVKPGFARNFLLMRNRADIATPGRRQKREAEMAKATDRRQAELGKMAELAEKISAESLNVTLNVGLNNQIFGSVTAAEVAKLLKEKHGLGVKTSDLSGLPIRSLGSHTVSAKLGIGMTATVPLEVSGRKTQADAADDDSADSPDNDEE